MKYEVERNKRGGIRFIVSEDPNPGDVLTLTDGRTMKYVGKGPAGMLVCSDENGSEQCVMPFEVSARAEVKS